ncbi:sensor domain-containing diguanylate cyclase [Ectopseudomonas oleovorans]|uniref:sensor domain-containing diguanylate cyclase n=1 Tax=Ectopseudomonas oleovorans TaxID=301 RepID=UPI00244AEC9B|nr:sensor domain-containing diguanylate cyclase [Pseudomonas oleovorans]MDH2200041.1 sensor domain-containing diguanylate cyclase [Pseudomonas oleovorans]
MPLELDLSLPTRDQLLSIIRIQIEIAKQGLDLAQIMSVVVERSLDLLNADGAVVELAEDEDMVYRAVAGIASGKLGLRLRLASSLSGRCVVSGELQRCTDTETDERVDRAACRHLQVRSMLLVPLKHERCTVGVLKVMSKAVSAFDAADEAVLGLLAEVLGADLFLAAKYASDDLYYRATHDEMTGLANRALFFDRIRNDLTRVSRDGLEFGLLMIDMDGLKAINDSYGHRAGDAAICEVARRVSQTLRKSDTIARLGGDEFGVILQPTSSISYLAETVERLQAVISAPFHFESTWLKLGVSIGTAIAVKDGLDLDALLDHADKAMYENKRERKRLANLAR